MPDILFLRPRPKWKRALLLSSSVAVVNASPAGDKCDRSLPLLFEPIERVELSLDAVVRMLFGLLEKIELRFVNGSRLEDADDERSLVVLVLDASLPMEPFDRDELRSRICDVCCWTNMPAQPRLGYFEAIGVCARVNDCEDTRAIRTYMILISRRVL